MQRAIRCLSVFVILGALVQGASAQDLVRDARFEQEGDVVVVTYDLAGETGKEYEVNLLVSMSGGETYDYQPKAVSGDVGKGVSPGTNKRIQWRVLEDFPEGLQTPNIRFKVTVDREGGRGWLYAVGSAVLVGGGGTAVAFLTGVLGGGSEGGESGDDSIPPLNPSPPE